MIRPQVQSRPSEKNETRVPIRMALEEVLLEGDRHSRDSGHTLVTFSAKALA